jgi:hypothetical protein
MNGLLIGVLKRWIETAHGSAAWDIALVRARLPGRIFAPGEQYPLDDIRRVFEAIGAILDQPVENVLEDFGTELSLELVKWAGTTCDPTWDTLTLLERTEEAMHQAVRQTPLNLQPPRIETQRTNLRTLVVRYRSQRGLCHCARGVIRGLAVLKQESLRVTELSCTLKGDPVCAFEVTK